MKHTNKRMQIKLGENVLRYEYVEVTTSKLRFMIETEQLINLGIVLFKHIKPEWLLGHMKKYFV